MRAFSTIARRARRGCVLASLLAGLLPALAAAEVVIHVPANQPTLTAAVAAVPNGGTIELAAGTYASPTNGFALSNLGKGFTIRAAQGAVVSLDGGGARPIFRIENTSLAAGGPIVFERIVFSNGRSTVNGRSGGVNLSQAEATFVGCTFQGNRSDAPNTGGGAVFAFNSSVAYFDNCTFDGNLARNEGGAIAVSTGSTATIHKGRFVANRTNVPNHRPSAAGGAIHVANATLNLSNCRFDSNVAGFVGGAVYAIGTWTGTPSIPAARVTIANSTFLDNRSQPDPTVGDVGRPEGGAVHGEDQVTIEIYSSRFLRNFAGAGGAISLYRAEAVVSQSVFRGNRADYTVNAAGGAIAAFSNDVGSDGSTNRRSASLTIRRSLLQGRFEAVGVTAHKGGCLAVEGDFNRRQGIVAPAGTATATRASLILEDSLLVDCDARDLGGAFDVELSNFTMNRNLILGGAASGACPSICASGGGGRIVYEALGTISSSAFAGNSATFLGGALFMQGADVDIDSTLFVENAAGTTGSAIYSGGLSNFPQSGQHVDMNGTISNSTFSGNVGRPVEESDGHSLPINDTRYDGNLFHRAGSTNIFFNPIGGAATAAQVNTMFIDRASAPDTDKSAVNNTQPGAAPEVGALLASPDSVLAAAASGDAATATEAFLGAAYSGGTTTLDGVPLPAGGWSLAASVVGSHTLDVSGTQFFESITSGVLPTSSLSATPAEIGGGGSSTLAWSVFADDFVSARIDQGTGAVAVSGSVLKSPVATTTYRLFAITEQGGLARPVTIFVDEFGPLFSDGFESGDVSEWSP